MRFRNLLSIILLLSGLSFGQTTIEPTAVTQTGLNLSSPTTVVGGTVPMTATMIPSGTDATGLCNATMGAWASANTGVATVSALGIVTGVAGGTASISCTIGGVTGSGTVTVAASPQITNPSCATPPCALTQGTNGLAYTFNFTASGGTAPYTWTLASGSLPLWASLSGPGVLSGTASTGTTTFTVQVTDSRASFTTLAVTLTVVSSAACGPSTGYACSCVSSQTILPPTNAPFSGLTGANTVVNDPEPVSGGNSSGCFHDPIARVSDANTATNACVAQSTTCAQKANFSNFSNSASGDVQQWSIDSSQFLNLDSGATDYVWNFNTSSMATSVRYSNYQNALKWAAGATFSRHTAKLVYALANAAGTSNGTILSTYDTSQSWPTLPTRTTVYDFASSVNGVPAAAVFNSDPVSMDSADTTFITGFGTSGAQNSQNYVAAYTKGSGISVWNTSTGQITGDYGTTGTVVCQDCSVSTPSSTSAGFGTIVAHGGQFTVTSSAGFSVGDTVTVTGNTTSTCNGTGPISAIPSSTLIFVRNLCGATGITGTGGTITDNTPSPGLFTIHNVKASLDGTYAIVGIGFCNAGSTCQNGQSPYFWQRGTNKIWVSCPTNCGGHWIGGYTIFANQYNTPFWTTKVYNPPSLPASGTIFPTTYCGTPTLPFDQHPSWWNNLGSDQEPIIYSTTATTHVPTYNTCTVAEIIGLYAPPNVAKSGKIIRFAHNYTTNVSQFSGQQGIMTVSPDGQWALFSSPMATSGTSTGQLGDTSGGFPCATSTCRVDTFVVKLQ